ncbi:hypothetical protein POV27_11835 [Aureisphaera galaxeae]|uniref:hypothetical protein n=1 Tax=Aureisphaera galaxeae TaxID=1538023 RepID=UPI00235011B8|nr:hypothetical protein [Aureisphaera galaxeae]MDC8004744.1 hypothetical protein [Aureisphaera galaxeae]
MGDLATSVYTDRIKNLRNRIVTVGAILLVFIITLGFIFLKQYNKKIKYESELSNLYTIEQNPWSDFQTLYDNSFLYIEDYTLNVARPYSQMCVFMGIDLMLLNSKLDDGAKNNPKISRSIDYITYAGRELGHYSNDLHSIIASQKTNATFDELSREKLLQLINIYTFNNRVVEDSLIEGINLAIPMTGMYLKLDTIDPGTIKKDILKEVYQHSFHNLDSAFTSFETTMLLNNFRYSEKVTDSVLSSLKNVIENCEFKNLKSFRSDYNYIMNQLKEIDQGENIKIPIINFNVSLNQIVLFGGLINLGVLLYFYFMVMNLKFLSHKLEESMETTLSVQDKHALFFGLDYQIKNRWLYVTINTVFFSALPIFSIILSNVIFENGPDRVLLISIVCIINLYFSIIISKILFQLTD